MIRDLRLYMWRAYDVEHTTSCHCDYGCFIMAYVIRDPDLYF